LISIKTKNNVQDNKSTNSCLCSSRSLSIDEVLSMTKNLIIKEFSILISAINIPLCLAICFGSYTLQLLFQVSFFGYVVFVVLDRIN
jgi:hypothetical protein